jgi:comEA protein
VTAGKLDRFWVLITLLLIAVIVIGGIIVWQHYSPNHPIEITLAQPPDSSGEVSQLNPHKIDINRAEGWLLEALPGIGPSKAQAIIAYREQNGGFSNIAEITEVAGIGQNIYENIRELITIGD